MGSRKMLKDGQVVIFETHDGETMAFILEKKEDTTPVREIRVPVHFAHQLEAFLEEFAPEFLYVPLDEAPDCMFRALRRSEN